jgi:hypothetical protein
VFAGNKGPESTVGPAFKFEDVNVSHLNLTGSKIPDSVGEGDRFRFVAQVVKYNPNQCLLPCACFHQSQVSRRSHPWPNAPRAPERTRGKAQPARASRARGISPLNTWSPAEVPGWGCRKLSSMT